MVSESHQRARALLDRAAVDGISPDEQRWLADHISQCAGCGEYANLCQRTVRALDSFAFDLDPAAALRVKTAVRRRARSMADNHRHSRIAILAAIVVTIAGSIAMWQPAAWLARQWELPSPAWQTAFVIFWVVPSALLDILLLFRRKLIHEYETGEGDPV